jgi:hypothetical protein
MRLGVRSARVLRSKRCLLALHEKLQNIVASKLMLDWSPEQVSGWLKKRLTGADIVRDVRLYTSGSEEGTWAAWFYDLLKPHVSELVVCNRRLLRVCSNSGRCLRRGPGHGVTPIMSGN